MLNYILVALFGLNAVATIFSIGEPRQPITKGIASFTVIVDALLIYFLLAR